MVLTINRYYATLRTLDKKGLIVGASEKNGNMPFRTVYSISEKGKEELRDTLTKSILSFDYDTNMFSIVAFFLIFLMLKSKSRTQGCRADECEKTQFIGIIYWENFKKPLDNLTDVRYNISNIC